LLIRYSLLIPSLIVKDLARSFSAFSVHFQKYDF